MLRLLPFLLFFFTFVESRFEDIINPQSDRQYLDLKNYNLTLRHLQKSLEEFQTKEIYEYFVTGISEMPNITTECLEDIAMIGLVLLNQSSKAYPGFDQIVSQSMPKNLESKKISFVNNDEILVKDASANFPVAGINRGPTVIYGFKQECDIIKYTIPHHQREFFTSYSRAFIGLTSDCSKSIGVDFCLPKSCSSKDLMNIIKTVKDLFPNITLPVCTITSFDDVNEPLTTGSWIMIAFFVIISTLGILAGITDYFVIPQNSPVRKNTNIQAFLAFSLYTNITEILRAPKIKKGQIGAINCIRVISMFWVIFGHVIEVFINVMNNLLDFISLLDYPMTQLVENAFFSVDSFFFIGGVLLSFMWFKAYNNNKKILTSPMAWVMFYVHRIIRLSAPFYVVYLTYAFLFRPIVQDMPIYLMPNPTANQCQKYWWKNMLYFSNLIPVEQHCLGHIWYLSTDMQMFVITPILLIPMAINPILGIIVATILFILSTAGNVITVYLNHYPPTLIYFAPTDPKTINMNLYNYNIYNAMWIRCQVYIMGILVGWMLQRYKRIKIHPLINIAGWILGLSMMLASLFGLFHYFNGHQLPLFWRAAYSALSKPAWGLGLTWIIVSCYYGYGGPINQFMSWNIWVPLGRLSYCAYLVHLPIAIYIFGLEKNAIYFSSIWQIISNYFFTTLFAAFFFALLLSALVEVPAGKLEALLLKPRPKVDPKSEKFVGEGQWDVPNEDIKVKL